MRCLDDAEVLDYVEQRLAEASIAEIREHLDACSDCLGLVGQLAEPAPRGDSAGLTLGRTISSGGMGVIVEAVDTLERRIAIKLPRSSDPAVRRRFDREVKITAQLQHPAIVPVYAAGTFDDGEPYYAMRLVDGVSLDIAIRRTTSLAERLALIRVVTVAASALAYAHSEAIIHRDVKPSNILVGKFGEVVVIDWGLARSLSDAAPADTDDLAIGSPRTEGATAAGTVLGTPAYMPPEQARGELLDERADVYALGAALYHVLRGQPPGANAAADLATAEPGLPRDLLAIVSRAMARDPNDCRSDGRRSRAIPNRAPRLDAPLLCVATNAAPDTARALRSPPIASRGPPRARSPTS